MMAIFRIGLIVSSLLLVSATVSLQASDQSSDHCERCSRHATAGNPLCLSRWARPSYGCHESGCYVGGGAPFHGDARCAHEGTWGWDYHGRLFPKRIWLGWHHGNRNQGGTGAYRTDGPHLLHH
jgi:hypothetical protein